MTKALGLIEVVGLAAAIEGADSALKAANVQLAGMEKVGSGILTVQIMGDVGAVTAAVEAGAIAAKKVGQLRSSHVIPRVDEALFGAVLKKQDTSPPEMENQRFKEDVIEDLIEENAIEEDTVEENTVKENTIKADDLASAIKEQDITDKMVNKIENYSSSELNKMSNSSLRELAKGLGIYLSEEKQKSLKKQDLITLIINGHLG